MSPQEYLRHYCVLNELPYHESWDKVIDYMLQYPSASIAYYTPYGWLFDLMHQFIQGSLSLEGLMTSGDVGFPYHWSPSTTEAQCLVCDSLISGVKHDNIIIIK